MSVFTEDQILLLIWGTYFHPDYGKVGVSLLSYLKTYLAVIIYFHSSCAMFLISKNKENPEHNDITFRCCKYFLMVLWCLVFFKNILFLQ